MSFKIATWNVNSLRVRLPQVLDWINRAKPDVLALQETKLLDADFPLEAIQQAGYVVAYSGQRTYNGVAILSRKIGADIITDIPQLADPQRRVLGITVGDVRILNLYVPNGESVGSDKYRYKLDWLHHLLLFLEKEVIAYPKMIILGDFNIAPEPQDVYDPPAWENSVLFSPLERNAFQKMLAHGFVDCFRLFEQPEKSYSWWDYRLNAFKRKMGLRIDHILASSAMARSCTRCFIDVGPRSHERPSDHAIVVAEFQIKS